jgi:hypothetical protein
MIWKVLSVVQISSFAAALFVPSDDFSLLKCEDKTKSLITASELPSLINNIND